MSNQQSSYLNKKGLTVKDLVTIGIFNALFFVFELIGSLPFAPNPALTFYQPLGIALLCGPVFLLMVAKVPKRGNIAICGIINGVIWFVFGMHWAMDLGYIVMGIVADLVAGMRSYKNTKWNIAAFALFCLGPAGVFLAYSINPTAWAQIMLEKGTSQEYIDIMANSAPIGMLPVILLGTVVIAIVSGLIGRKLLKKQFEPHEWQKGTFRLMDRPAYQNCTFTFMRVSCGYGSLVVL